jgi:RAB protein geranylgeranyltransferase component A
LEPVTDGVDNHCFISKSYDATSHFETAANDVLSLYKRITGASVGGVEIEVVVEVVVEVEERV